MHTKTEISKEYYFPHQQGIALITVLGLLSLMIIMAVSFAITMRTERVAAGNYLDTVKANHLVRTALHKAMADLYQDLHIVERESCSVAGSCLSVSNASLYPDGLQIALHNVNWTNYPIYSSGPLSPTTIGIKDSLGIQIDLAGRDDDVGGIIKRMATNPCGNSYPSWVGFASYSSNNVQRPISLTNNALSYIPASLIQAASSVDTASQSNYWINIDTVVNGKTTTVGRVAYLIVNCSGLLDANYVGGKTRASGTDPAEIAIEYLNEIAGDTASFTNYRTANGPFETLPKLADWKSSWHPSNMFCYSGCLENEWVQDRLDIDSGGLVDISGDAGTLKLKKDEIIQAFDNCGLTNAGEAETAYINLVDYVDNDSYAGNEGLGNPMDIHTSVEAVPMINEVMFSNTVTIVGSSNYFLVNNITVELWYPFNFNNTTPFDIELDATIEPKHSGYDEFKFTLPSISMSSTTTCSSASFKIYTLTFTNNVVLVPPKLPPSELKWEETITKATVKWLGQTVDQLDNSLSCIVTSSLPLGPTYSVSTMDKECIDPRFNWDTDSTNQWSTWSTFNQSIGDINQTTTNYWPTHSVTDNVINVANRPLQQLDELSRLIYSTQPWMTIDPPTKHKIYEYFRLGAYPVLRGFVNPNTHIRDVLAATFYKVQAHTNGVVTTGDEAEKIAQAIIDGKAIDIDGKVIGYKTIQEVTEVIKTNAVIQSLFNSNPIEIDALIANTVNLLRLRQNIFTIIIEVQVASGGNFPSNPAKQRAVAIVWRDPFRDNFYVRSLIFY